MPTRVRSARLAQGEKGTQSRRPNGRNRARPSRKSERSVHRKTRAGPRAQRKSARRSIAARPQTATKAQNKGATFPSELRNFPELLQAPEEKELRRKRAELSLLESELGRQASQLSALRAEMIPFQVRYFREVGIRFARLDELEARVAENYARVHQDDKLAQEAARRARERAERSRNEIERRNMPESFNPPPALKRLYRAVARSVHPDLSEGPADRQLRERLMACANRAYRSGNERRLGAIVSEYKFRPEKVSGEGTAAELVRVIRKVEQARNRFEEIREEMELVRSSRLFRFKRLVESKAAQGRDLFTEVVSAVDTRIDGALRKLNRPPSVPCARPPLIADRDMLHRPEPHV